MSRLLLENASRFALICLATSKDSLLKKYPDLKEAIETFVQQDPTDGTLKYAEWEIKVLKSRQALSQEEDILALLPLMKEMNGSTIAGILSTIDPPPHREIMEWIIANVQNTAMVMRARRRLAEFDEMHKAEASFQPSILKQAYEFAGNQNYHDEFYPYSNYFYPGQTIETQDGGYYRGLWPRFQDRQRDGKEFKEFSEFKKKRKNRLKRLKMLRKIRNLQSKPLTPALPATPLTGLYGEIGIEGLYTSPLEYYSGSIADGPNANTNPNYTTYQVMSPTASDMREARMKLGASKDWWRLSQ